jgi:dTDP-4-amino-4,6-dideoxygalactose transaminase
MGRAAVFSFNGNKIITTSGGGMLVTGDASFAERARCLASQARQPAPWYEHTDIGFNYRMSNILAALGRAQLSRLGGIIERRRRIRDTYAKHLDGVGGIHVMGDPPWGQSNAWLTTVLLDPEGAGPDPVIAALGRAGIEARHVWKPMHLQPVFAGAHVHGGAVAEDIFARGLCLPSGARLSDAQLEEIAGIVAEIVVQGRPLRPTVRIGPPAPRVRVHATVPDPVGALNDAVIDLTRAEATAGER